MYPVPCKEGEDHGERGPKQPGGHIDAENADLFNHAGVTLNGCALGKKLQRMPTSASSALSPSPALLTRAVLMASSSALSNDGVAASASPFFSLARYSAETSPSTAWIERRVRSCAFSSPALSWIMLRPMRRSI